MKTGHHICKYFCCHELGLDFALVQKLSFPHVDSHSLGMLLILFEIQVLNKPVPLGLQPRDPRLQLQYIDVEQVLLVFGIIKLLAKQMDVLQNGNLLLRENLNAVFLGDHRALVLGILQSCGLRVVSNARDLYLNFLRVLAHGVDVLLCFGIGLSLPFDLILHHLGLLLHYLSVIESIFYPPYFELRVS